MNETIGKWFEQHTPEVIEIANNIWMHPEKSLEEYYACQITADWLQKWGFSVEAFNVKGNGQPNAVVAKWGSGKPVIGLVGEYDALKNLGQEAVPVQSIIPGPGHGCGHNLIGACGMSAAAALKEAMVAESLPGTVVYLACPAEETLEGKLFMKEAGYFDDLDICLMWHPVGKPPSVVEASFSASGNWIFEFHGKTAHAAAEPWNGRSALDAAELMNVGVQYLREHMTEDARIHYSYIPGDNAPNVVPEYAALNYYIRSKDYAGYQDLAERVKRISEGAALMTDTTVESSLRASCCESKINHTLNHYLYEAAIKIPTISYTQDEIDFARELYKNVTGKQAPADNSELLSTSLEKLTGIVTRDAGSTDLNWITHMVPTSWIFGFGMVLGLPGHHWGQTAVAGMSIGQKGALFAGKALAQCGYDCLEDPNIVEQCWQDLKDSSH